MSGMAHFFMSVGGSKFHERLAHFFIDIYMHRGIAGLDGDIRRYRQGIRGPCAGVSRFFRDGRVILLLQDIPILYRQGFHRLPIGNKGYRMGFGIGLNGNRLAGPQAAGIVGKGQAGIGGLRGGFRLHQVPSLRPIHGPAGTVEVANGIAADRCAGDSAGGRVIGLPLIGNGLVVELGQQVLPANVDNNAFSFLLPQNSRMSPYGLRVYRDSSSTTDSGINFTARVIRFSHNSLYIR